MITAKDIDKLKKIYHLVKVEGYTLDRAKAQLKSKVDLFIENNKTDEIVVKLQQIKTELLKIKSHL